MPSQNSEIVSLRAEVARLSARLVANDPNQMVPATVGFFAKYGCKVTEGSDATDMVVKLEGQASGDSANLNPKLSATPSAAFQYPNIASCPGGMFRSADTTATVTAVPSTGTGRYDIAYIFQGKDGGGFQIAAGTASAAVKTDFDTNGLQTADYGAGSPDYDPALPAGALPVARIYVEDDVTGIPDARIADIRDLTTSLYSGVLAVANNLSDVGSASTSRTNLGVGDGDSPTFAGETIDSGASDSLSRITGRRSGSDYGHAALLLDTPRSDTSDGGSQLGRGAIKAYGNSSATDSYLGLLAQSASIAGTTDIATDRSNQLLLELYSGGANAHLRAYSDGAHWFEANENLGLSLDGGSNYIKNAVAFSITPTLRFGGGTTGITYTRQSGSGILITLGSKKYTIFQVDITLSSKGTDTGNATMVYPYAGETIAFQNIAVTSLGPVNTAFTGGAAGVISDGGTTITFYKQTVGQTAANVTDADFQNTTTLRFGGVLEVA